MPVPRPNERKPSVRTAAIIAIGSELLTAFQGDSNSLTIASRLNELGIDVRLKHVVGDDPADLSAAFVASLARVDLVITTGGLGPTADDITRSTVARALDLPLEEDAEVLQGIERRFAARGQEMPAINRRQAMVPRGATVLVNPNGTAPGLWIAHGGRFVLLLPGPPREMRPMLDVVTRDRIGGLAGALRIHRRVLKVTGRTESQVESVAEPIYARWTAGVPPISTTILAPLGQIELHLRTPSERPDDAERSLDLLTAELAAALGPDLFSTDGRSLEEVVGDLLRSRRWRIALAESCTGGLASSRLTDVAGSSDYVERAFVCYSDRAKIESLGIPESLIREHGAVSEEVARAMAAGARARSGVEVGLGITGIAGPGGGSAQKPVGTVVIAIAWPGGESARRFRFMGGRTAVKSQSAQAALDMVRRAIVQAP